MSPLPSTKKPSSDTMLKTINLRMSFPPYFCWNLISKLSLWCDLLWLYEIENVHGQPSAFNDWTHLDDPVKCGRGAGCPRDCCVEVGHFDDMKAPKLLFRVGVRTVQHLGLVTPDPHGRRCRGRLQASAVFQHASLHHRLHVGFVSAQPVDLLVPRQLGPARFARIVHQNVFHLQP